MVEEELDEEQYNKAMWHFRSNLARLLEPLRLYGQGHYVDAILPLIEELAWQWRYDLEGLNVPYDFEDRRPHW